MALLPCRAPRPATPPINTQMWPSCEHLAVALAVDEAVRVWWYSYGEQNRASSAGATCASNSTTRARSRRMRSSAWLRRDRRLPEATIASPRATSSERGGRDRACLRHVRVGLNMRLRFSGAALGGGRPYRRMVSLRPRRRQVPAALLAHGQRRERCARLVPVAPARAEGAPRSTSPRGRLSTAEACPAEAAPARRDDGRRPLQGRGPVKWSGPTERPQVYPLFAELKLRT